LSVRRPKTPRPRDPYRTPPADDVCAGAPHRCGLPTWVGAVVTPDTGPLYNRQILWDPERGPTATYDKRQIQPFGEYLPLRSVLKRITPGYAEMVRRDFGRGTGTGVFDLAGTEVGLATCYEAAFDWTVRDSVTHGAQLISVPSNNATFDRSEMTYQQLAMSRVRAVEHSRTVVVPVTSGVSAIIQPDGRITRSTGMFTPDALVAKVPLRSSLTPATRLGTLPEALLAAVAVAGLGWVAAGAVRARRAG
ncbi:apolipoprotein N-acyltransferase, partial [Streptomyces sp. NPDC059134]|uniref:apolipoprotein N-acyltransferase n=1 Tax=Streptomyces sp. NPDC059134 TaxID=3346738 RepID=UPI0036770815